MTKPTFVYTTYIKTTPEKVWRAITNPEFTNQYWGKDNISDWKVGSKWQHIDRTDNEVMVDGKVLESNPPHRLVLSWVNPSDTSDVSQVSFDITQIDDMVRLDVLHGDFKAGSDMAEKVSNGWPRVLSSMKSFLETGTPLNIWCANSSCAKNSNDSKSCAA